MTDTDFPVAVGDGVTLSKTLTETDLAFFTAMSGDFDPLHTDEQHARSAGFKGRLAHGILSMALLSGTASMMSAKARERGWQGTSMSLGYDRIRFVHPVFVGDTLTATYTVEALDAAKQRSISKVEVANQDGTVCVAGQHLMKWQSR